MCVEQQRSDEHPTATYDQHPTQHPFACATTEQLPALEHGAQLPGGEDGAEVPASEYEAARVLLRYLRDRVRDLDRDLPPAAQAEVCRCLWSVAWRR
jgi:hypothetical protein